MLARVNRIVHWHSVQSGVTSDVEGTPCVSWPDGENLPSVTILGINGEPATSLSVVFVAGLAESTPYSMIVLVVVRRHVGTHRTAGHCRRGGVSGRRILVVGCDDRVWSGRCVRFGDRRHCLTDEDHG